MGNVFLCLVAAVAFLFISNEKFIAILLHGGELVFQPINDSIGLFKFLGHIRQDASNGPWPGFLERVLEAFGLGTQFPCVFPLSKVQHICSTWGAALVMTESGKVVAHKQLPRGSHFVGMDDVRHTGDSAMDDPTGSYWSMGVAMLVRFSVEQWFELHSNSSQ